MDFVNSWDTRAERKGTARANSGWEVFKHLYHMPQPDDSNKGKRSQFKISKRNNIFVVREGHLSEEMKEWKDTRGGVLLLRESVGKKQGKKLKGIRTVYQIRAASDMRDQHIMFRFITCACVECVKSNYDACLTNSVWTTTDLTPSNTIEEDIGNNEDEHYDGMENVPLLAGNNAWAAKAVQSGKTGNLRGIRIQRRDKVKEADISKPARKAKKRISIPSAATNSKK